VRTEESSSNIVKLSDIRASRQRASSPYGPVRAGLTTLPTTQDQRLTELLNSLESEVETPELQILHGIRYIGHRYRGSACRALAHSDRRGWY
jgi:hypothetical protein